LVCANLLNFFESNDAEGFVAPAWEKGKATLSGGLEA
jgi:hypothetical protein